jgi:hypothetical protein
VSDKPVVQNAVDSDQTGADAIADGTTVHMLFIEENTGNIFHTYSSEPGVWQPPTLRIDGIQAQWIRGTRFVHGEDASVYGFVYDAGSDGGTGMNKYSEIPLNRH